MDRRTFLQHAITIGAGTVLTGGSLFTRPDSDNKLTILYTNDTHARLDPFPDNATQFAGLGGIAKRANLVKKFETRKNVLLFDAGDVFQGTPWFDVYGGEVDLKLMSEMKYDAMAVGNHEFDYGLDSFAETAPMLIFPFWPQIMAPTIHRLMVIRRFIIKEMAGIKVGIFGLGIDLREL